MYCSLACDEVVRIQDGSTRIELETELMLKESLPALDKLDSATGAFRKHNKGIDEDGGKVVNHVNTGIPGAPGSLVGRLS